MDWDKDYTSLSRQMGWPTIRATGLSADLSRIHRKTMAALDGTEPTPTVGERFRAGLRCATQKAPSAQGRQRAGRNSAP